MSGNSHIKTLFDYHWHTTNRLMEGAAKLTLDDYHANPGFGHGSVHDLLFHLLRTDRSWRLALAGFAEEQVAWQALLGSLTVEEFEGDVDLTNWRGEPVTFARWRVLHHLVLHGMQHHAELAALLTAKGQSPGNIDFIFYE
jgi:uncharacterized damage-inducible protein DinB